MSSLPLLVLGLGLNTVSFSRESPCDRPGNELKNAAAASVEACEAACGGDERCAAYVFISGWGRCFEKSAAGKAVPLRFYAGEMQDGAVAAAGFDRDYSGKDLRRVTHVGSGEACGRLCAGEPGCKAFTYIGGYADCWLKQTVGVRREKVFSCGVKKH